MDCVLFHVIVEAIVPVIAANSPKASSKKKLKVSAIKEMTMQID